MLLPAIDRLGSQRQHSARAREYATVAATTLMIIASGTLRFHSRCDGGPMS